MPQDTLNHNMRPINAGWKFRCMSSDTINSIFFRVMRIVIENPEEGGQTATVTFQTKQAYATNPTDPSTAQPALGNKDGFINTFIHDGRITNYKFNTDGSVSVGLNISTSGAQFIQMLQGMFTAADNTIKTMLLFNSGVSTEPLRNINVEDQMKKLYEAQP